MAADPTDVSDDRSGDRAPEAVAVQELYERHAARVYSFCLHQLGNREEAEDATQSTFLNAFRGLRRGVAPVAETAWLLAIARNVCLTRVRSTVRRRRLEAPRDLQALQDTVPARAAAGGDELLWLGDALSGLPANQRRAILLREWQGLSYDEIAADLGTTHGAVETLIFRGRRTLAQRLEVAPRQRVPQRVARWLDFGAAAGWAKALLAGGTAKAVATAMVVATVTVAGSAPLREDEPPPAASAAPPSGPQTTAAAPPVAWSVLSAKATKAPARVATKRVAAVRRVTPTPPPSRGRSGTPPPPPSGASESATPVAVEASEPRARPRPSERARQRPVRPNPGQPEQKPEEQEQGGGPPAEQTERAAERGADEENRERGRQNDETNRDDDDEREDEQQETENDEDEDEDEDQDEDEDDEQDEDEDEEDDDRKRNQP